MLVSDEQSRMEEKGANQVRNWNIINEKAEETIIWKEGTSGLGPD